MNSNVRVVLALAIGLVGCQKSVDTTTCGTTHDVCAEGGHGAIAVTESGLPAGVVGTVTLSGPSIQEVTRTQTLAGVGSGQWRVSADRVAVSDPRVRTVYTPTVNPAEFCLPDGGNQPVTVTWAPVPSSHTLWVTNGPGGASNLEGFGAGNLLASGTPPADLKIAGPAAGDLAFDEDGNLWSAGATTSDAALVRFPASALASSGTRTPDRNINLSVSACIPMVKGMAFAPNGDLYVASPCNHAIYRLDASSLGGSSTVTPALTLTIQDPVGLAFDRAGNLWAGDQSTQRLFRFDAASLAASGTGSAPAYRLGGLATDNVADPSLLTPNWLAFDSAGNLWANDFGGNIFFRMAAADLRSTGDVSKRPAVRITASVLAVMEGFAFDEEGGLWSAGSQGKLVRFGPEQLDTPSGAGAPTVPATVLSSADIGYVGNVALYPAPAFSPLYSRLP